MTTPDLTPGQRQPTDPESNRECKRYKATETDDESAVIDDCDTADIPDLDDEGFRFVRHRKSRTVGIPVIITPVTKAADLKKLNPIAVSTEIEEILGASKVRSRFTAQGALLLDVQTEDHVNALLSCKSISGAAISARVPNSYLQSTSIIRGVPECYTDEELLNYLKPQAIYHAWRVTRRVQTSESKWESRRTRTVVLTLAPNTDRPEKINLGFTRQETIDYVETPRRCFKCQRYGYVAKYCRGDQRLCKRFDFVRDGGFLKVADELIAIGAKQGSISARAVIPHPTTVPRRVSEVANELREAVMPEIQSAMKEGHCSMTLDIWTDDYKKVAYITGTAHYSGLTSQLPNGVCQEIGTRWNSKLAMIKSVQTQ
ncbi:hypothetical protein HPB49_019937 [Dermacentor silvarum]|uniref:Uncharacterized protein n=1 Tax=Dermacentor silvarum TaxID=543639 RepID=A0ACB8D7L2_DERSI|nr:hypothetical protein HPB49_019937 [Dermacentor silvarum]